MKVIEEKEVRKIVSMGKEITANEGTKILDEFEKDQPLIYQLIYGEPSDAIAELNLDMANLYLDLSFDVIFVFHTKFGRAPTIKENDEWFYKKMKLLDAELKSISTEATMNSKIKERLQDRFVENSINSSIQMDLLKYLNDAVIQYAKINKNRMDAIGLTNNLLFVLVRMFGELYSTKVV